MELAVRNQENAPLHHSLWHVREIYQPPHQKAVEGHGDQVSVKARRLKRVIWKNIEIIEGLINN